MSSHLDMPLDQIIAIRKTTKTKAQNGARPRRVNGKKTGALPGVRKGMKRSFPTSASAKTRNFLRVRRQGPSSGLSKPSGALGGQKLQRNATGNLQRVETCGKLFISNLHPSVTNTDVKELFGELGMIQSFGIHYDKNGRSMGTADVVYARQQDALMAIRRYNNVLLDGRPLRIEQIGISVQNSDFQPRIKPATKNIARQSRSANVKSRLTRPTVQNKTKTGNTKVKSIYVKKQDLASQLDAELDKYHKDAMQIN